MKYTILLLIVLPQVFFAQTGGLPAGFAAEQIASGLNPTSMAQAPDGRLFLAQKDGRVLILHPDGALHDEPFIQLNTDFFNERGLNGIALHPNFEQEPWVYVYYTVPGVSRNRISRVLAIGDYALPGSEQILIELDSMSGAIHNGGSLTFGPDGNLYAGVGDGAKSSNAQNLNTVLGKILRLRPNGSIPDDNPFYQQQSGKTRAIFALGVRNPFSMACDLESGRIFFCDVGAGEWEEINTLLPGKNYGWSQVQGNSANPAFTNPLYSYDHGSGCAIVGASFGFQNNSLIPDAFQRKFLFADYCKGWIHTFDPLTGAVDSAFITGIDRPVSLLATPAGELYYLARAGLGGGSPGDNTISTDGTLWRVFWIGDGAPHILGQPQNALVPAGEPAKFEMQVFGSKPIEFQWFANGVIAGDSSVLLLNNTTLADSGTVIFCVARNAWGTDTSQQAVLRVTNNRRPEPAIALPFPGVFYKAGDTLHFAGSATDPEEGSLPAQRLRWRIDFHHDAHTHPALPPTPGLATGQLAIPIDGETDTDVFYRIYLTARDSMGLEQSVWVDVKPLLSAVHLLGPAGIRVNIDGAIRPLPVTLPTVQGMRRIVQAPEFQKIGDDLFYFNRWSDGSTDALLSLISPDTPRTYTLLYDQYALGNGAGLWGEYFFDPERDFDEPPLLSRMDTVVRFDWGNHSPDPAIPDDYYTVRWTGFVQPVFDEVYTFYTSSDDGCRLWVGDSLIIDRWKPQSTLEYSGSMYLEAGKKYPIRLEYLEVGGGSIVELYWRSARQPKEIVPRRQLYPPLVVPPATLRGRTGFDINFNGVWAADEPVLVGVRVQLFSEASDTLVAVQETLSNGTFTFPGLPEGQYYLHFQLPALGDELTPVLHVDAAGYSPAFDLPKGAFVTFDAAWGVVSSALYGDVWLDENRNDVREAFEPGLAGMTVLLYQADSTFVAATSTDSVGGYVFSPLDTGVYFMVFLSQLSAEPLIPGLGMNTNGQTDDFHIASGQGLSKRVAFQRKQINAVNLTDDQPFHMRVCPNPVRDVLWLEIKGALPERAVVEVSDIRGRLLWRECPELTSGENTCAIRVDALPQGVYLLRLSTQHFQSCVWWVKY